MLVWQLRYATARFCHQIAKVLAASKSSAVTVVTGDAETAPKYRASVHRVHKHRIHPSCPIAHLRGHSTLELLLIGRRIHHPPEKVSLVDRPRDSIEHIPPVGRQRSQLAIAVPLLLQYNDGHTHTEGRRFRGAALPVFSFPPPRVRHGAATCR